MADKPTNIPTQDTATQPKEQFVIQHIYVKDVSFETPNTPQIFREPWKPQLQVEMTSESNPLDEGVYEVVLNTTCTVTVEEKTAFLVEVHQAGIFTIAGFDADRQAFLINTTCLHILFPYARATISNLVLNGGFHPLLLPPPNFETMYAQRLQQAKVAAKKANMN